MMEYKEIKELRAKCAHCHTEVVVSKPREFKTCKCGKIFLDFGDGYYYRMGGMPEDFDKEYDKAHGIDRFSAEPVHEEEPTAEEPAKETTKKAPLFSEQLLTPAYCSNGDEFNKLFYTVINHQIVSEEQDDEEVVASIMIIRALLHDYLALVLSGEIVPYEIDEEEIENNASGFQALMRYINCTLSEMGVPMREVENGKVELDYDALCKLEGSDTSHVNYVKRRGHGKA